MAEANWDLTPFFPSLGGPEYSAFRSALADDTRALQARVEALSTLDTERLEAWCALLGELEDVASRAQHLSAYLGCRTAADAREQDSQREQAAAVAERSELEKVFVVVRAALRDADDAVFEQLVEHESLRDARYFLLRMRRSAQWSMSTELETLAADLDVTGFSAWGRLYSRVSGTLEFDLEVPGRAPERRPVSVVQSLLEDADREVRTAAFRGGNRAWQGIADVAASCLNAIAGTRLGLYARRGVGHFLEPALFDAGISQATLDALLEAVRSRQEVARRYLRRKAQILGLERLDFQDLTAPLPLSSPRRLGWDEGRERVLSAFESFYPDLARFAGRAFERRWIDYESRPGKAPGGFCTGSKLIGESRVFLTFHGALGDASVLAHELGHAFHSWLMREQRPWATRYPMTLAETASTFAEQLVIDAVLNDADAAAEDRAAMLDSRLSDAAMFLLNIPMRFDFERAVYTERASGELSVDRLCALVEQAQRENYGDALGRELNPWFWASKLHFYITGTSFYNFPYTFGYLFSTGIFARARREGPDFLPRYETLLRLTGSDTPERCAERALGVDLTKPDFWHASIDLVEADLERFESETSALFR